MSQTFDPEDYGLYFEYDFRHRWLRPDALWSKLQKFEHHSELELEVLGKSIEGRPVRAVRWGSGSTKVMLWSQMHGNEPTATMALMDILNFLTHDDEYKEFREMLREKLSLVILPMLNPDGAERFTRQNALGVDLNRDTVSRQMPEMKLFLELMASFKPHWGFNLHDQRSIFSAGDTGYPATMSFLAPSADPSRKVTPAREKSMKLIGFLADLVEEHLPRHIGRYSDEFYPRALGDFFHQQEIPCVLIESGAYYDDPYRDQARRMNFLCLLEALRLIANDGYQKGELEAYQSIPENRTKFYDLIIRQCEIIYKQKSFVADIGLQIEERPDHQNEILETIYTVKEVGDLKLHFALQEEEGGRIELENGFDLDKPANIQILREKKADIIIKKGRIQ